MSQEERWRDYGRMVDEYAELKRTLAALSNRAEQQGAMLHQIADALIHGDPCPNVNVQAVANPAGIVEVLGEIQRCKRRLEGLKAGFRNMGLEIA